MDDECTFDCQGTEFSVLHVFTLGLMPFILTNRMQKLCQKPRQEPEPLGDTANPFCDSGQEPQPVSKYVLRPMAATVVENTIRQLAEVSLL